jgi:hypothetical protein
MKIIPAILMILCCFFCRTTLSQSVEDIWSEHIKALGGHNLLDSISSVIVEQKTIDISGESRKILYKKKGGKIRIDKMLNNEEKVILSTICNDGETAWIWKANSKNTIPIKVDDSKIGGGAKTKPPLFYDHFVEYKQKGYKMELAGKDTIDSQAFYKIKISISEQLDIYYYINTQTYMIHKTISKINGRVNYYTLFDNYKNIYGLMMPLFVESRYYQNSQDKIMYTDIIDKIVINPKIDDRIFKCYPSTKD